MCRSGAELGERGFWFFDDGERCLLNERVFTCGFGRGVLHVEGIFDGSLMGGREEVCVGGLVVVVVETRKEKEQVFGDREGAEI